MIHTSMGYIMTVGSFIPSGICDITIGIDSTPYYL